MKTIIVLVGFVFVWISQVHAQDPWCAQEAYPEGVGRTAAALPPQGQFRALVVYVRFADDMTATSTWPVAQVTPPDFADDLIAADPDPTTYPGNVFPEKSLTRYFFDQSLEQFTFYGDTHPTVYETINDEFAYYSRDVNGNSQESGFGVLTREILDALDPMVDFNDYDVGGGPGGMPDGEIDYLIIVLRANPGGFNYDPLEMLPGDPVTYAGVSHLERRSGSISDTNWGPGGRPTLVYDGVSLNWDNGSYVFNNRSTNYGGNVAVPADLLPIIYHVPLWAHEVGHDIWTDAIIGGPGTAHLREIPGNDVPFNQQRVLGYALMPGGGTINSDAATPLAGDELVSAFERDLLGAGWINCQALGGANQLGVTVGDLYDTNECATFDLDNGSAGRTIYVSNRQRISFFDQLYAFENPVSGFTSEDGLMTTGLLVGLREGNRYDEIPADNTLDIGIFNSVYAGDLFGPGVSVQLTPWTRPNINGFTVYPAGFTPSWEAIDNVRFSGNPDNEMAFDYIEDFRQNPIIREDSWMGEETSGTTFSGNVVVVSPSVLNISTTIGISNMMIVNAGSEALLDTGADVTINTAGQVAVFGQMDVFGTLTNNGSVIVNGTMTYETNDAIATGAAFLVETGADVTLQSGTSITLEPGFQAQLGSTFQATIGTPAPRARIAQGPAPKSDVEQASVQGEEEAAMQQRTEQAEARSSPKKTTEALPTAFSLGSNYPNPFNPSTEIRFALPEASRVSLVVYDVTGREVARLVDGPMEAGVHRVTFDAAHLSSGLYLYRMVAGTFVEHGKMLLMK